MGTELTRHAIHVGETHATLITSAPFVERAEEVIRTVRKEISDAIAEDPRLLTSREPIRVQDNVPPIIRRMVQAASQFGVGPMAAVAGGIAQVTVEVLIQAGATHVILDNGGDIVLRIDRPVVVGVFTGGAAVRDIGFRITPRATTFSVCTSSGTVGHSLSFGRADAATVTAADGFCADAAATALGNRIKTGETAEIEKAIDGMLSHETEGMLVVAGDRLGMGGSLPELIRTHGAVEAISYG